METKQSEWIELQVVTMTKTMETTGYNSNFRVTSKRTWKVHAHQVLRCSDNRNGMKLPTSKEGRQHRRRDRTGRNPGLRHQFGLPNSPDEAPSGRDSHLRDRSWLQLLSMCSLSHDCTSPFVELATRKCKFHTIPSRSPTNHRPLRIFPMPYHFPWLDDNYH